MRAPSDVTPLYLCHITGIGFKVPKEFKMANVVGEKETKADVEAVRTIAQSIGNL